MARHQMVDRNLAGTARDEQEKARGPGAVRWPSARIDEDFDHYRHEQQAESGKACRKPEHEQYRKKMLAERRQVGGCCRVDDRQLVLVGKEGDRARFEMQARDLGLTGLPEYCGGEDPGGQRDQPIGKAGLAPPIFAE